MMSEMRKAMWGGLDGHLVNLRGVGSFSMPNEFTSDGARVGPEVTDAGELSVKQLSGVPSPEESTSSATATPSVPKGCDRNEPMRDA